MFFGIKSCSIKGRMVYTVAPKMEKKPQFVVSVDPSDSPIGLVEKQQAHREGVLHRAFSIFLLRRVEGTLQTLLQQRALHKYHSGGLWTNTCCSHAEADVPVEATAQKRLEEEMGFSCPLHYAGSFLYRAEVGNSMVEHEIDHVFAAFYDPPSIRLNPEEAENCRWEDADVVQKLLLKKRGEFTAWFPQAFEIALDWVRSRF